jgi:cobalamin biosynthesis Mg chelatase CobN
MVSGITRDNFVNCIEIIDEVIHTVAMLDEPVEMNFVRKHTLDNITQSGEDTVLINQWRREYNQIRPHSARIYAQPAPESMLAGTTI